MARLELLRYLLILASSKKLDTLFYIQFKFFGFLSCVILIVIIVFWIMKLNQEARLEKVNEKDLNQVVYNSELRPTQYENEVIGVNTIGSLRRGSPAGVTSFYATPPGMMQQPQTFVTNVIESEVSEVI